MENNINKKIHLELIIAFILSFCSGFCDGYTLLFRDGTFAYMQTGNLVKFIIFLVNGSFEFIYFMPIVLFMVGVLIATILNKNEDRSVIVLLLMSISFLGVGFLPNTNISNIICICILSIIGAMQYQTFRKCGEIYYSSTMCTNNMRLLIDGTAKDKNYKKTLFFLTILIMFSLGVLVSTLLGKVFDFYTISFLSLLSILLVVFELIIKKKNIKIE